MTVSDTTAKNRRPAGRSTPVLRVSACRCGQQLDCCARRHCPRCGRTLSAS